MTSTAATSSSPLDVAVDDRADLADSGEAVEGSVRFQAYCRLRDYGVSPGLAFALTQANYASPSIAVGSGVKAASLPPSASKTGSSHSLPERDSCAATASFFEVR